MVAFRYLIAFIIFLLFVPVGTFAQTYPSFAINTVVVCPASEQDQAPPDKSNLDCQEQSIADVDPQGRHIWVFLTVKIPENLIESYEPLGLGISAKASSLVYLNDREVGRTGLTGDTKLSETPGRMDTIFPLRESALKVGLNDIAIKMSSHHGVLNLKMPVHSIYVSRYENPQSRRFRRYAPSLLPFGVFIIGALYFLIITIVGQQKYKTVLLSLMSLWVACQLFAEVSRGVFAYLYPFHDYRLLAILMCSAVFGVCLALYSLRVFLPKKPMLWCGLIGLACILSITVPKDFDMKSGTALLSQTIISVIIALTAIKQQRNEAIIFSLVLGIFATANIFGRGLFLDVYYYYILAGLMLFLFAQQALAYGQEQALRQEEEIRANKLQLVLDQKEAESQPVILSLSEAGKIHRIGAANIVAIKGADDYVEVTLENGKTRLITSTLNAMEKQLPSYFLRVHRSHIVNMNMIVKLERETSGSGRLNLNGGIAVPVSRRIMPTIRKALA